MKQAKGTPAARKRASELQKAFFSDPENRRKRSIAMKGKFLKDIGLVLNSIDVNVDPLHCGMVF